MTLMTQQHNSLLIGTVTGVHGIKGWVKIRFFLAQPAMAEKFKTLHTKNGAPFPSLKIIFMKGETAIVQVKGIPDRTAAEHLKNTDLFIDSSELPPLQEDTFYHADLIGLEVQSSTGNVLGTVINVHDFGAGPLLEIKLSSHKETVFAPFRDAVVPIVDLKSGFLHIDEMFIDQLRQSS